MQKAQLLSVLFKRARPLICLQATLMGSADARSENYILHEPCESTFTVFPDKCPQHHVLDCVNS